MWAYLATFLFSIGGALVTNILIGLGFGTVTYFGLDALLTYIQGLIFSNWTGLPANMTAMLALMDIDVAVNIIISALVARGVIAGFTAGSKRVMSLGANSAN